MDGSLCRFLICIAIAGQLALNTPLCHAMQAPAVTGGNRKALVIGNGNYVSLGKISTAASDGKLVSAALKSVGFEVTEANDLGARALSSAVDAFISRVSKGDIAFLYYSGLAVQSNQENYILPIDFSAGNGDLFTGAYSVSRIDAGLYQRGSTARVLILDACREIPPLVSKFDGGLAVPQSDNPGVLISLSAQPGRTEVPNPKSGPGIFAEQIAKFLTTPGLSIEEIFSKTQAAVVGATARAQIPMYFPLAIGSLHLTSIEKHSPDDTPATPGPHIRGRYDSVVIGSFQTEKGVKIPPKIMERLTPALAGQLGTWHLREIIADGKKPAGAALKIEGIITAYTAGSRVARFAVGYGVGVAKTTGQVRLIDAATGKLLYEETTFGAVAGGVTGGRAEDVMIYFAQAILQVVVKSGLL